MKARKGTSIPSASSSRRFAYAAGVLAALFLRLTTIGTIIASLLVLLLVGYALRRSKQRLAANRARVMVAPSPHPVPSRAPARRDALLLGASPTRAGRALALGNQP